jgi:hypothetical protein
LDIPPKKMLAPALKLHAYDGGRLCHLPVPKVV